MRKALSPALGAPGKLFYLFIWLCLSCSTSAQEHWAQLPQGMWDLGSGPGMEPESSVLEGGFLTTGPPGRSQGKPFILLY